GRRAAGATRGRCIADRQGQGNRRHRREAGRDQSRRDAAAVKLSGLSAALAQLRDQLSAVSTQLGSSATQLGKAKDEILHVQRRKFNATLRGEFIRLRG